MAGGVGGLSNELFVLLRGLTDEAKLLLDALDDLNFGGGGEVSSELGLAELLDELSESTSGNIHSLNSVWD